MDRQLIIAGPARSHPFRHFVRKAAAQQQKRHDDTDLRLFAMSFTAFFVCFYTFIC